MRSPRDRVIAFLMLLPSLLAIGIFVYFFIFRAWQTSQTNWGNSGAPPPLLQGVEKSNIGLANYDALFTDMLDFPFRNAMTNTFFFTVFFVGGCLFFGLLLALLLDQNVRGEAFFRTLFLFPMSLSFVVTGTIWRWMLQPGGGVNILPQALLGLEPISFRWMNSRDVILPFEWHQVPDLLTMIGLAIVAFYTANLFMKGRIRAAQYGVGAAVIMLAVVLTGVWSHIWPPLDQPALEPNIAPKGFNLALVGIIIAAVWQMSGYTMAMFIAGIRGISDELREAARVDGCTEIGIYRYIILPQLNPIVLSAMIVLGHISLKIFDLVFAMAGPDNAQTIVPGIMVYTKGFRENQFAKASAIAVIMLITVGVIIVPYLWSQLRTSKR
ncbi:MAG: sugar ABC transporter permease [Anaerolineae bacterium]